MGFSITNLSKAQKLLVDVKEKSLGVVWLTDIVSKGKNELLDNLDEIGRLLKESWRTRSTSHKVNDFSSIQAESSLNLQKFYKDALNAAEILRDGSSNGGEVRKTGNKELDKEIEKLSKKISNEMKDIVNLVNNDQTLRLTVLADLKDEQGLTGKWEKIGNKVSDMLSGGVKFSDVNKNFNDKVSTDAKEYMVISGGIMPISVVSSVAVGFLTSYGLASVGGGGLAGAITALSIGAAAGAGFLGATVGVAAIFLIAGLVIYCNRERLATIAAKRHIIKIQEKTKNMIKYINEAAKKIKDFNQKTNGDTVGYAEILKATDIANEFFKKQKELWGKYTSAEKREYNDGKDGKHKSGLLTRLDDRGKDKLQQAKLELANKWVKISDSRKA